jgi:hypothetical protein
VLSFCLETYSAREMIPTTYTPNTARSKLLKDICDSPTKIDIVVIVAKLDENMEDRSLNFF